MSNKGINLKLVKGKWRLELPEGVDVWSILFDLMDQLPEINKDNTAPKEIKCKKKSKSR